MLTKLFSLTVGVTGFLLAQTSAYQAHGGTTSIMLDNAKGSLSLNVTDTKFTAGFLHESGDLHSLMFGGDVFGKPATSFSKEVFQKGTQPPQVGGDFSIGMHGVFSSEIDHQNLKHGLRDDWILGQFTYSRSSPTTVTNDQTPPQKRTFDGYKAMAIWNGIAGADSAGTFLIGLAAGVQCKDNSDNLQPVQIMTPVLQSATGVSSFEAANVVSGYKGQYKKLIGAPIYSDCVYNPKWVNWLSIDAYTRSDAAHMDRYIEWGLAARV